MTPPATAPTLAEAAAAYRSALKERQRVMTRYEHTVFLYQNAAKQDALLADIRKAGERAEACITDLCVAAQQDGSTP